MMTQTELIVDLGLILLFFIGSWFFSGFESGMVSLNRYRLVRAVRNGDPKAKALATILRDMHRLLATTLVGNNICNVTLSTLSAALAVAIAAALGLKGPIAQTIATLTVAILLLIVGEFLPKLWFTARPIERCAPLLPIFRLFQTLLAPLASLCILLTRLVSGREKEKRSPFVSRENIAFLMRDSEANGEVSAFERLMVSRVLDLQFKRASQLMTPLHAIARINHDAPLTTVLRFSARPTTASCRSLKPLREMTKPFRVALACSISSICYAVQLRTPSRAKSVVRCIASPNRRLRTTSSSKCVRTRPRCSWCAKALKTNMDAPCTPPMQFWNLSASSPWRMCLRRCWMTNSYVPPPIVK